MFRSEVVIQQKKSDKIINHIKKQKDVFMGRKNSNKKSRLISLNIMLMVRLLRLSFYLVQIKKFQNRTLLSNHEESCRSDVRQVLHKDKLDKPRSNSL